MARSDVYSLAAVLYEMLAGEARVTGSNAQAMIAKLMTEKPSGDVVDPAISPDGKQLAFVSRTCEGPSCTYSVTLQDVGGTPRRATLDGANERPRSRDMDGVRLAPPEP